MNWDDPAQRLELLDRVGQAAYNKAMLKHKEESIITTVGGHAIRPVGTKFGRLFSVGDTGTAYALQEKAEEYASKNPLPGHEASVMPAAAAVAAAFSGVMRKWLTPDQMREVILKNRTAKYAKAICATHEYCDANMAMSEAMESLNISVFSGAGGSISDDVTKLWNESWEIAKTHEFRRTLSMTDFGTYGFVFNGVSITGFLTSENTIDQYDPSQPEAGSIPEMYGFSEIGTGGGCTAWHQEFLLEDGQIVHLMITDVTGTTHKISTSDRMVVGVYMDEEGCAQTEFMTWEQDNFPLDQESNLPAISVFPGAPVANNSQGGAS